MRRLRQGNLDMVPDMVKQFVVYFYRHIRYVRDMHTVRRHKGLV